ncbi:MAG: hypothetical protein ACI97A_000641, partial [Planctomycetota bacterium]
LNQITEIRTLQKCMKIHALELTRLATGVAAGGMAPQSYEGQLSVDS